MDNLENKSAPIKHRTRMHRLKNLATVALLTTTTLGANIDTASAESTLTPDQIAVTISSEYPTNTELDKLTLFAKSPVFTDLEGNTTKEMGYGGLAKDTDGNIIFCTASHIAYPYEARFKDLAKYPNKIDAFHSANYAVRTSLVSQNDTITTEYNNSLYIFQAKLAIERGTADMTFENNPTNDPPVCFEIPLGTAEIVQAHYPNFNFADIPYITTTPVKKGSVLFAFDRNIQPQFYTFDGRNNPQGLILSPTTKSAQSALSRGDSGTPFYRKNGEGKIEMVGVFGDTNIDPTTKGPLALPVMIPFGIN